MATENKQSVGKPGIGRRLITVIKKLGYNRNTAIGSAILIPILFATTVGPLLVPFDPNNLNPALRLAPPSAEHWFGTDAYGRDLFVRTLLGGRISIAMGVFSSGLALLLGVPLGLIAGYFGGKTDELLMRLMDVLMSFPTLLLALLVLISVSQSLWGAVIAVGLVYAPRLARVVRGNALSIKNEEFVKAAKARGESHTYIMFKEIFPNITGPIVVEGSIRAGYGILIATSLSFLGLGAQPPTPDWGFMIAEARNHLHRSPYFLLFPSLFLGLTIIGFNVLGDGLRDVLDVKEYDRDQG